MELSYDLETHAKNQCISVRVKVKANHCFSSYAFDAINAKAIEIEIEIEMDCDSLRHSIATPISTRLNTPMDSRNAKTKINHN